MQTSERVSQELPQVVTHPQETQLELRAHDSMPESAAAQTIRAAREILPQQLGLKCLYEPPAGSGRPGADVEYVAVLGF